MTPRTRYGTHVGAIVPTTLIPAVTIPNGSTALVTDLTIESASDALVTLEKSIDAGMTFTSLTQLRIPAGGGSIVASYNTSYPYIGAVDVNNVEQVQLQVTFVQAVAGAISATVNFGLDGEPSITNTVAQS